jgi:hypothetical protein
MCITSCLQLSTCAHNAVRNQDNRLPQIKLQASDAAPLVSSFTLQDFPSHSTQIPTTCYLVMTNSRVTPASKICRPHNVKHEQSCSTMYTNLTSTAPGGVRHSKQMDSDSESFAGIGLPYPAGIQNPDTRSLRECSYTHHVSLLR